MSKIESEIESNKKWWVESGEARKIESANLIQIRKGESNRIKNKGPTQKSDENSGVVFMIQR